MGTFPGLFRVYLAKNGVRGSQRKGAEGEPGACKNTHARLNILALGQSCETPKCFLHWVFNGFKISFRTQIQKSGPMLWVFSPVFTHSINSLVTFAALSESQSLKP